MNLVINGEPVVLEKKNLNVIELLEFQAIDSPDMVSLQINGEFISKESYTGRFIKDNDSIDFLYFMGGGR